MKAVFVLLVVGLCIMMMDVATAGFGCPNNYACHQHCKSIRGYCGGYCASWFRLRCTCYRCGGRRDDVEDIFDIYDNEAVERF
ncbi:Hypothetical predicted protein [Mytilus galloprovincialis]|uniref:Invertebrate defensins family profile domain-containing protein n=1 Tax=Mytilus galloprovincialis TaxID=29158 RepID=A0A8B6GJN6_MYTGA|nr:Hypothetical predicted protein [Mytilus galloprovincialis]